ncbi:MAG TPA: Fic family protein [Thermoanaerobaculia bacterium]
MMSFRGNYLGRLSLPLSSVWLIGDIGEAKGRQELYTRQAPQLLQALRETALVQSVESSNRIEGVTVAPDRLLPLVLENSKPRDRSEQEIRGYRRALDLIHTRAQDLEISPQLFQRLHALIQEGSGDAGKWKHVENELLEFREGVAPIVRFRPVAASEAVGAIEELCLSYRHTLNQDVAPPLLATAALILDFLCIHPFRDGNGRVSRLLTLLALYQHGYEVGRYISLERLVEESRLDYYDALLRSSQGWHENQHDLFPWLNYFLAIVKRAYKEFERRVGQVQSPRGAKTTLVEATVAEFPGTFTLADLERAAPGVSRDTIRQVLRRLQKAGTVECLGRGPGATWGKRG